MEPIIINDIPLTLDVRALHKRLHVGPGSAEADELQALVDQAQRIGRPKALGGIAYIDERGDDYVVLDAVRFSSRILAVNMQRAHRAFPYIATCGLELQEWADALSDPVQSYWSEAIREQALGCAAKALDALLDARFSPGHTARMNPGSLTDWPLREQRQLFHLLGDPQAAIGVRLTASLLMIPTKTVSGIRFPTEATFESCQLCPRIACPGRRAPYDPELYDRQYKPQP
jgi:cobalamin-dependent methionine synthase I